MTSLELKWCDAVVDSHGKVSIAAGYRYSPISEDSSYQAFFQEYLKLSKKIKLSMK